MIRHISFTEPSAGFAVIRLNNVLLASQSTLRAELFNAYTVELNHGPSERDVDVVADILSQYEGAFTDVAPPPYMPFDPGTRQRHANGKYAVEYASRKLR